MNSILAFNYTPTAEACQDRVGINYLNNPIRLAVLCFPVTIERYVSSGDTRGAAKVG